MAVPSDNGGWPSDGGSPDDLPDLPEEWGVIVIPDDLSELSDEVEAVRAELRLTGEPTRWRRFTARPAVRRIRRKSLWHRLFFSSDTRDEPGHFRAASLRRGLLSKG